MPVLESIGNTSIESNATEFAAVYIASGNKKAKLQYFSYAQSRSHTATGVGETSGWIPIAAETRQGKTTVVIKHSALDPALTDYPFYQAVDFDPITGSLVGIHRNDGGYKTREQIEADFKQGQPDQDMEFLYFDSNRETEFLARFDWVINPGPNSHTSTATEGGYSTTAPASYGKGTADIITNYNPKTDSPVQIDLASFSGASGTLNIAKKTKQVAKLAKKDIDFIYDQQAGYLYYNRNGKLPGFGDGGIFAILEGKPKVGLGNFEFV
jgi:hypothetical protein